MKFLILCLCAFFGMAITCGPARAQGAASPADLHRLADDYYNWRNQNYPVASSDAGLHTWDNKLTDYSLSPLLARRLHVKEVLAKVRAMQSEKWSKDDRIDWLLFRSQLESITFFDRVMDFEESDPQTYVNECSNGIFSLLKNVYYLPIDAKQLEMLGQTELARYRGLESMLPDPSLADPNPARAKVIPKNQNDFLKAYESREAEMIAYLKENHLVTLPPYLGRFEIRQLPEAFKPTSPGGFMNAPGVYDKDSAGFYFIPTYNPQSRNFYIRAAIEDPRPILGHEGIPGHFLQLSIANHLKDEIRRQHGDGIMVEGWALYGEEMLMRTGLYPLNSASQGQVLRLARYRAARVGVDVNLHTGRWTFEQAVKYFMEAGGLDREAAEGEAAGAAASPTQKIYYMTGKWQIMRLLGKYRDKKGKNFRLGEFHDDLIRNGSLPLSIIEWILLDDRSSLDAALK